MICVRWHDINFSDFYTRLAEHIKRSFKTGNLLVHLLHSAACLHATQCFISVSDSDFRVIASTTGFSDQQILESPYIFKQKLSFNGTCKLKLQVDPIILDRIVCSCLPHFHLFSFDNLCSNIFRCSMWILAYQLFVLEFLVFKLLIII
jgi:hypothetical protein